LDRSKKQKVQKILVIQIKDICVKLECGWDYTPGGHLVIRAAPPLGARSNPHFTLRPK
jgi:hypothetical protein